MSPTEAPALPLKHRLFLVGSTIIPPIGLVTAIVLLWGRLVSWVDLVLLVVFYVAIGLLGLSLGYHRLLTHRSFKTYPKVRFAMAALGTMGAHGPPLIWVAHHRRHHQFADREGDPHSPHVGFRGRLSRFRGLWHAHSAWRFRVDAASNPVRYAPDILRDRGLMWLSRHYIGITVLGVVLPGLVGLALTGTLKGLLTGALWGGLVRMFMGQHVVYSVNSLGHFVGPRRFETRDESRNLAFLSLLTFGDSWHNNHHAFPTSSHHGMRWWEIDLSGLLVRAMRRVGLAWDLVTISRERQAERIAQGLRTKAEPPEPASDRAEVGG
jgi:stearoyl-CoA desaturase (delta-9 desaturase)